MSTHDCIFCKMSRGEVPVSKLYEDDDFFCIRDIQPQAPTHLLVISKEHIRSLATAFPVDSDGSGPLMGRLFEAVTKIARQEGLLPRGFRTVINTEKDGGQTVFHLHLHLLGGELLKGHFN